MDFARTLSGIVGLLPQLATHYRRKDLLGFQDTYTWLKSFTSKEPDLDSARRAFFEDGGRCIDVLEKYLELTCLAVANQGLTVNCGPIYVKFISDCHRKINIKDAPENSAQRAEVIGELPRELQGLRTLGLEEDEFFQAAQQICDDYPRSFRSLSNRDAEKVWVELCREWKLKVEALGPEAEDGRVRIADRYRLNSCLSAKEALDVIKNQYDKIISSSEELGLFTRNIRALVHHVGCPEAHGDSKLNLNELRRFNSTQVPFLAKLQNDLQEKMSLIGKQQEIITALVFRHLIENLPDPAVHRGPATQRWQSFWKASVMSEINTRNTRAAGHPLGSLAMNPQIIDRTGNNITPASTEGQKGLPYKVGAELYGLLSTNIHSYKANARDKYQVPDDQWGEATRKTLRALIPQNYDPDGEVDWVAERARY